MGWEMCAAGLQEQMESREELTQSLPLSRRGGPAQQLLRKSRGAGLWPLGSVYWLPISHCLHSNRPRRWAWPDVTRTYMIMCTLLFACSTSIKRLKTKTKKKGQGTKWRKSDSHKRVPGGLAGSPQYVLSEETIWRRKKVPVSSKDLQAPFFKDESVFQQVSLKLRNKPLHGYFLEIFSSTGIIHA